MAKRNNQLTFYAAIILMIKNVNLILTRFSLTPSNPLTLGMNLKSFFRNSNQKLIQNVLESSTPTTYKSIESTSNSFTATVIKSGIGLCVFVVFDIIYLR